LLENQTLNEKIGARIFLKPEVLQRTGSFKFRGAYNRLSQIPMTDRPFGVVAWSSGNHAQGVAAAAKILGMPAAIVMPHDAPSIKIEGTKNLGADVVLFDRYTEDREVIGKEIAAKSGATIVPSYDDPGIIAGQGTVGLEIMEDAAALGADLDKVFICCGGGGLSSGSGLAIKHLSPATEIFLVEPQGYDDFKRSLETGKHQIADITQPNICDALLTPTPGHLTFALNKRHGAKGLTVSEDEVRHAMKFAFETLKLVVEPGGSVALAAALSGKLSLQGQNVALILSGGNVDPNTFSRLVAL
jgi:threonine dehydratase